MMNKDFKPIKIPIYPHPLFWIYHPEKWQRKATNFILISTGLLTVTAIAVRFFLS